MFPQVTLLSLCMARGLRPAMFCYPCSRIHSDHNLFVSQVSGNATQSFCSPIQLFCCPTQTSAEPDDNLSIFREVRLSLLRQEDADNRSVFGLQKRSAKDCRFHDSTNMRQLERKFESLMRICKDCTGLRSADQNCENIECCSFVSFCAGQNGI